MLGWHLHLQAESKDTSVAKDGFELPIKDTESSVTRAKAVGEATSSAGSRPASPAVAAALPAVSVDAAEGSSRGGRLAA